MEATTVGYVAEGKEKTLEVLKTVMDTIESAKTCKAVQINTMHNTNPESKGDVLIDIKILYNSVGV